MSNINCNVIKDLLPSYLEDICSQETKKLVEEHLNECNACKGLAKMMAETELSAGKADLQEIDYMKKVKRHFMHNNLFLFGLLLLLIVVGMVIVITNYGAIPLRLYYVILPVLLLGTHHILSGYTSKKGNKKWQLLSGSLGTIGICYGIGLTYACSKWAQNRQYPFGMEALKVGPFVYNQFLLIAVCQIGLFLCICIISLKNKERYTIPMTIHITGAFLNLSLISILKRMTTLEAFISLNSNVILFFLIEGVLLAIILLLLDKRWQKP